MLQEVLFRVRNISLSKIILIKNSDHYSTFITQCISRYFYQQFFKLFEFLEFLSIHIHHLMPLLI